MVKFEFRRYFLYAAVLLVLNFLLLDIAIAKSIAVALLFAIGMTVFDLVDRKFFGKRLDQELEHFNEEIDKQKALIKKEKAEGKTPKSRIHIIK